MPGYIMKYLLLVLLFPQFVKSQDPKANQVYTVDIDNFWNAYDSIAAVTGYQQKVALMQRLYVDKGTEGLKAFMRARSYNAESYVKLIAQYPAFWKSVRPQTLTVRSQVAGIEKSIERFRGLYPELKPAGIYFAIGILKSGGATTSNMVLIGTEMAMADTSTDATELNGWLKSMFGNQLPGSIVALNVHEFVHTQQKQETGSLLSQCLLEGSADFITELVTRQKNLNDYMIYGKNHEATLKLRFRNEMWRRSSGNWLYNGGKVENADLGYFMGYTICKTYYDKATDKKQAVKDIIELDFASKEAVTAFLDKSGYYGNPNLRTQ